MKAILFDDLLSVRPLCSFHLPRASINNLCSLQSKAFTCGFSSTMEESYIVIKYLKSTTLFKFADLVEEVSALVFGNLQF